MNIEQHIETVVALRKEGKGEEAFKSVSDALTHFPDDPRLLYQAGWTCDFLGSETRAVGFYEQAIEKGLAGEELRGALLGLGSTYRCLGNYQKAQETLERGLEIFPDGTEFEVFLAMTQYNLGKSADGMAGLLRVLLKTTSDPHVLAYRRALEFYSDKLDQTWV